jgi:DNA invertase Pin-like site-specific DNA recombinase
MRAAIYARYSSELQSEHSIEDQLAICRNRAAAEGWVIVETYTDYALSGATMERPGIRELVNAARTSQFDLVLTESLDRLSRDQEDIAGLYKRLTAWQVKIITLSEGEVSELHIGLKGTMNALFLKDLAAKSLRGQLGKARSGLAAGGIPYGYKVVKEFGPDGELIRGKRKIVAENAVVVRRIFEEFAAGRSAVAIAKGLNAEAISAPRGGTWNPSTIHGHRGRGVGILHNPLYRGRQVFNRHAFVRDPDTGTRRARMKDRTEWVETPVPELAIVDDDLWQRVHDRLASIPERPPEKHRRPKRLFSGLIECGKCGGQMTIAYRDRYGCSGARQKGICDNKRTMAAPEVETRILSGLRESMMQPEMVKAFIEEFHAELQRRQRGMRLKRRSAERERNDFEAQIERLVDAIADGSASNVAAIGDKLRALEEQLSKLASPPDDNAIAFEWHPNAVELYKRKIDDLQATLNRDDLVREEATVALRGLVDKIIANPGAKRGQFELELHGHLAAAINMGKHGSGGGGRVR